MKTHNRFYIASAVWWFAETWYFGWNMLPESRAEAFADGIVIGLAIVGFRFDLLNGISKLKYHL